MSVALVPGKVIFVLCAIYDHSENLFLSQVMKP